MADCSGIGSSILPSLKQFMSYCYSLCEEEHNKFNWPFIQFTCALWLTLKNKTEQKQDSSTGYRTKRQDSYILRPML